MSLNLHEREAYYPVMYQRAILVWSAKWMSQASFSAYLDAHLEEVADAWNIWLDRAPDLFLAAACLLGQKAAIAALKSDMVQCVQPMLTRRFGLNDGDRDDVFQELLKHLLMGPQGKEPKLRQYHGNSGLRSWLIRVAFSRSYNWIESNKKHRDKLAGESDLVLDSLSNDQRSAPEELNIRKQEWSRVKDLCRQELQPILKVAFRAVFDKLTLEERFLLRMWLIDQLTQEKIGQLLKRNKSNVSRKIKDLCARLPTLLQAELDDLGLEISDLQGLVALLSSQLDLSLPRLLPAPEAAGRENESKS